MNNVFQNSAANYFKDGIEKIRSRDWQLAIIEMEKALSLDSSLLQAQFHIGFAKRELHLNIEAIEDFENVLRINSNHIAALLNLTYCLCSLNRNEEALVLMDKVIEIDADWYSYMQRASIKKSLGDFESAKIDEAAGWKKGHDLPF